MPPDTCGPALDLPTLSEMWVILSLCEGGERHSLIIEARQAMQKRDRARWRTQKQIRVQLRTSPEKNRDATGLETDRVVRKDRDGGGRSKAL